MSDCDIDETRMLECMKHQVKMSPAFAKCKDPELYCKFRSACLIHFMERERSREKKAGSI